MSKWNKTEPNASGQIKFPLTAIYHTVHTDNMILARITCKSTTCETVYMFLQTYKSVFC